MSAIGIAGGLVLGKISAGDNSQQDRSGKTDIVNDPASTFTIPSSIPSKPNSSTATTPSSILNNTWVINKIRLR